MEFRGTREKGDMNLLERLREKCGINEAEV